MEVCARKEGVGADKSAVGAIIGCTIIGCTIIGCTIIGCTIIGCTINRHLRLICRFIIPRAFGQGCCKLMR